jgi:formylglycine-generating enzyme required for sulfatase activity
MAQIFLCHASEDKPRVREVYGRLRAEGLHPWLDEENLLGGQLWEREIPIALKASDFILIFFSQNSIRKIGYVQNEFKLALETWRLIPGGMIHTIPVRLDNCEIPGEFRRFQWINLFEERGFERIIRAIRVGWSQRPRPASEARLTNSIGVEFVLIPAGTFMMGSPDSDAEAYEDETPAHRVTISQPFYLGQYAVTQGQWEAVMGTNPSEFTGDRNRPVEQVSWEDTQEFIRRLNTREGGARYRLPTEAEWEYACRAGSHIAYSFGNGPHQLDAYGWYEGNSGNQTHPVGQLAPNAWGLYDMHGNVWEWVQDWFGVYAPGPVTDPEGPTSGSDRVLRGGSWNGDASSCRSAYRVDWPPGLRDCGLGFRLLRTAP